MKNLKTTGLIMLLLVPYLSKSQDQNKTQEQPVVLAATTEEITKLTQMTTEMPAAVPQEEPEEKQEATFSFSGSVDTYFHTTFGGENPFSSSIYGPSTSFADLKGFSLGMVNLIASYSGDKAGFVADVVFGPRGKAAVFGTASGQAIINQMYAYYKLSDVVTLNLGQFNTFVGYEVISPVNNFHYSTSYLFSWGPFNHTGLRADFAFNDGLVAKLSVMNPTDIVEFNPVDTYTLGAQIGKTGDFGGVWFNFLYGDQDGKLDEDTAVPDDLSNGNLFQGDITLSYNVTDKFSVGFNSSYQTIAAGEIVDTAGDIQELDEDASSFYGFAVYPKVTLSESFALGLRAEYFSTKNFHFASPIIGVDGNGDGNVMEFTLSGNYKVSGLTIIPEVRFDTTSEDSFVNKDGETKNTLASFNLAAVYKF
jgi:hypothetical protein